MRQKEKREKDEDPGEAARWKTSSTEVLPLLSQLLCPSLSTQ